MMTLTRDLVHQTATKPIRRVTSSDASALWAAAQRLTAPFSRTWSGPLKDMVSLRPGEAGEIITRFAGYRGRYLLHRHNAEHEDVNGRFRGLSDHLR
ncbi:hypothetical protein GCM10027203_52420 [Nonomuraea fastidiosa]